MIGIQYVYDGILSAIQNHSVTASIDTADIRISNVQQDAVQLDLSTLMDS